MSRADCENRDRCGKTGHFYGNQGWQRCPCLQLEINKRALGPMYCEDPFPSTKLSQVKDRDLLIEGPLVQVRRQIARVLLEMSERGESYLTMDAYRLIEIFLRQDEDFDTLYPAVDAELLIILLGFGDPRNRYLPELLVQGLMRRSLTFKATWVILGLEKNQVAGKYSQELAERVANFQHVVVK